MLLPMHHAWLMAASFHFRRIRANVNAEKTIGIIKR